MDYVRINTVYSNEEQHLIIKENLEKVPSHKKIPVIFDILSRETIGRIIHHNPSTIAVSFSESRNHLEEIKKDLPDCEIIAKIESEKGVRNFAEILDISCGVMVARGDLGRAVSLERVPCLQKRFSKETLEKDKFLIIATEMLLSMVSNPQPTKAEVSDVANAVFDGAKAVMLSEETAIGKNPVEAVRYMRKIILEAEGCV